ncbi:hypothetical protein PR202_gb29535 [Eleusine coracana subsp. coracana]|uniref:Uncharacterized protein n=1 Tax=Eleusine coracana subsp. coracana TaxID=191504 RepID=A0AAV5G0N8_ELECO|nr:hypothetical protein PR202_gb29535 [Eleusine coracana subsp. coracana]
MAIRSAGGDSYVMANYLPVCMDPAVRIWLTSLLEEPITSSGDLNRKLIECFQATCNRPGNHFDLTRIFVTTSSNFALRRLRSPMSQTNKSLPPSKEGSVAMIWFMRSVEGIMTSS